MYIKQSELLWGLDNNFIKEFIESAMKKTHPEGYKLFSAGDSADFFYILLKGSIRLSVGEQDKTTYLVEHAGEAFGWSGLVGIPKYSASAECAKESMVMVFAKEFVQNVTDADPENGMRFYRRLARMIGNRLIHSYHLEIDGVTDGVQYTFESKESIEPHQNV
ncbi:MAG: Crp/Fnr family transcriptional regulator [Desulfobulbaceae bacterium]|nr:Crp/Fnr family transcriptional regulator [Desulfobulbaceae bacterium]